MNELILYNKYGAVLFSIDPEESSSHDWSLMSENKLSVSFEREECTVLAPGCYVEFDGIRFYLLDEYKPRMINSVTWKYDVAFLDAASWLSVVLAMNIIDGKNLPIFNYTGPAREHAEIIVANLNRHMGTTEWKVGSVIDTPNIAIEYRGKYCSQILQEIVDGQDTEWWVDGMTLNIGRAEFGDPVELGYRNGLLGDISREQAAGHRAYAYLVPIGSTRNIDPTKYGYDRLQLPDGQVFVDINPDGVGELIEERAFAEIYPRYEGTVQYVRSMPATGADGNEFTIYYIGDMLPFNPNDYEIAGLVKRITFQSGELMGESFEVNYNAEAQEFEIITQFPEGGIQLPGGFKTPATGDKYVIWNITMPDEYYALASQEYLEAAEAFAESSVQDSSVYKGSLDYIDIQTRGISVRPGRRVRLLSDEYFSRGYYDSRITRMTRRLWYPNEISIDVSAVRVVGSIARLETSIQKAETQLSQLSGAQPAIIKSGEITPPSDKTVYTSSKSEEEFLNKRKGGTVVARVDFKVAPKFLEGADFGGGWVKYDTVKKCFIFTENVLFEKGLAWNSSLEGFNPQTITQAISYDPMTLKIDEQGRLTVIGGAGSGTTSGITQEQLQNYLTSNNYITESALEPYAKTADVNSLLTEYLPKSATAVDSAKLGGRGALGYAYADRGTYTEDDFLSFINHPVLKTSYIKGVGDFHSLLLPTWTSNVEGMYYLKEIRIWNDKKPQIRKVSTGVASEWDTFAFTSDLANYLPLTGGEVNGNITATGYFDSSASYVEGDLKLTSKETDANTDSGRIIFAGSLNKHPNEEYLFGPYIQGVRATPTATWGRKKISFFQRDFDNFTDSPVEVMAIHPNGDVSITGSLSAQSLVVNGSPKVTYDAEKNAFVLPANLLVEGGIAWNSKIDGFDVPTITDAVSIDGTSIIRDGGVLRVSPDYIQSVGGLDENELSNYLTANEYITESALDPYAKTADVNSLLTDYLPKSSISDWALASEKPTIKEERLTNLDLATPWTAFYTSFQPLNRPDENYFSGFTLTNVDLQGSDNTYLVQLMLSYSGKIHTRYRSGGSFKAWNALAFTSDIPTKLSQLTDDVVKGNYLPLTGGEVNGNITVTDRIVINTGIRDCLQLLTPYTDYPTIVLKGANHSDWVRIYNERGADWVVTDEGWQNAYKIIHEGNYSNYALPITGGTVSGDITITGNVRGGGIWRITKDATYDGTLFQSANYDGTSDLGNIYITAKNGNNLTRFQVWAQDSLFKGNITATGYIDSPASYVSGDLKLSSKETDANTDSGRIIFAGSLNKHPNEEYLFGPYIQGVRATPTSTWGRKKISFFQRDFDNFIDSPVEVMAIHPNGDVSITGNITAQSLIVNGSPKVTYDSASNAFSLPASLIAGNLYGTSFKGSTVCLECNSLGGYDSEYEQEINCFSGALYIQNSGGYNLYLGDAGEKTIVKSILEVRKSASFEATLSTAGAATIGGVLTATTQMMIGSYDAPSQALEVRGNILATGEVVWNSSRVLKNIIGDKPTYLSLGELMAIKPYRYKWRDGRDNKVHAGGIADEVLEILPEVILTDANDIHSMDYGQAAFTMAASLTPYVSDHERRISELETENKALKQEIEKLKRVA